VIEVKVSVIISIWFKQLFNEQVRHLI